MRQISITTEQGTATYPLAPGAPAPTIKGGALVFHTTSGVQSVPAGAVLDFVVETAKRQTKEEKLVTYLQSLETGITKAAEAVLAAAEIDGTESDRAFYTALDAHAAAVIAFKEAEAKAKRFLARRAETLAKREAKAAAPAATPEPKKPAKKTTKK